jgi:hypothetical protein
MKSFSYFKNEEKFKALLTIEYYFLIFSRKFLKKKSKIEIKKNDFMISIIICSEPKIFLITCQKI